MAEEHLSKFEIAERQLETAIGLLVSGADYVSAVTLAGAADSIFMALVLKAGKDCYVDDSRNKLARETGVETLPRDKYASSINKTLGVNALKHMDSGGDDHVTLDLDPSVVGAVSKAVSNYMRLVNEVPLSVRAYMGWVEKNRERFPWLPTLDTLRPTGKLKIVR